MRRATAVGIDILAVALLGVVAFVVFTGGRVYELGAVRVSVRSVDNPLIVIFVLLLLRYHLRSWAPPFANPRWDIRDVDEYSSRVLAKGAERLTTMPLRSATVALAAITAAAVIVKGAFAWISPGFYSGDDVEVHEMTIAALRGHAWPVWELRSPFFPLFVPLSVSVAGGARWV